jgi:Flp pilus assembly pilin Flp
MDIITGKTTIKYDDCVYEMFEEEEKFLNEDGQTLVEFVLLLIVIMTISFTYMSAVNRGIADYWVAMGNTLLIDVKTPSKRPLELR